LYERENQSSSAASDCDPTEVEMDISSFLNPAGILTCTEIEKLERDIEVFKKAMGIREQQLSTEIIGLQEQNSRLQDQLYELRKIPRFSKNSKSDCDQTAKQTDNYKTQIEQQQKQLSENESRFKEMQKRLEESKRYQNRIFHNPRGRLSSESSTSCSPPLRCSTDPLSMSDDTTNVGFGETLSSSCASDIDTTEVDMEFSSFMKVMKPTNTLTWTEKQKLEREIEELKRAMRIREEKLSNEITGIKEQNTRLQDQLYELRKKPRLRKSSESHESNPLASPYNIFDSFPSPAPASPEFKLHLPQPKARHAETITEIPTEFLNRARSAPPTRGLIDTQLGRLGQAEIDFLDNLRAYQ